MMSMHRLCQRRRPLSLAALVAILGLAAPVCGDALKTFDGKHPIGRLQVRMVYFVPQDRTPLPDWRERLDYFRHRIEAFHAREFQGQSRLDVLIHPQPFRSQRSTAGLRAGDADAIFFTTLSEVAAALQFGASNQNDQPKDHEAEGSDKAFPILLVLSDINWRPLDDFYRLKPGAKGPEFEGTYHDGRHYPGAASGGARATYLADHGKGWGLVSADGWRVPYEGSDCVISVVRI